jgi:hypothetical protein
MSESITRKNFLKKISFIGVSTFAGGFVLSSCGDPERETPAGFKDECTDLSGLSEADKETREMYEYVGYSPYEDKSCSNCNLYIPPEKGNECGGCQVVKGPINPLGHSSQWIAKAAVTPKS